MAANNENSNKIIDKEPKLNNIIRESNATTSIEKYNILCERVKQIIESGAFLPLDKYTSQTLRHFDITKRFSNENLNKIASVINHYRTYYIKQVQSETNAFFEKYSLDEKLNTYSEASVMERLLSDLKLTITEVSAVFDSLDLEKEDILAYYSIKFLSQKDEETEKENEILKEELASLLNLNNLNIS